MSRRQLLGTGVGAGTGLLLAHAPSGARAAIPPPAPAGDDVGFLAFGAVAEGVLARYFDAALKVRGAWTAGEKRLLDQAHGHHRANVDRINAALGPDDAVTPGAFSRKVPIGTRAGALKVGRRLETLVGGAYLGGLAAASDYGTRLLLGRLLAVATTNEALLARWASAPLAGLPSPVDLDAAGLTLDAYLEDPMS